MDAVRISDILSVKAAYPGNSVQDGEKYQLFSEYMRASDYAGMLSCDLRHMTMARINGIPYKQIALNIAKNCPNRLKWKYPEKFLRLAYEMYVGGLKEEFMALMDELRKIISLLPVSTEEREHLTGEWLIVSALPHIRDIRAVREIYENAAMLMYGKSAVIDSADPITLGGHGFPGVYLIEPGIADELLPEIARVGDLFSLFTGEPLVGMDILYEGSLAYYRGDIDKAGQLIHRAIYLLESTKQDILQISAGELLAMIATHQGDVVCFAQAAEYLEWVAARGVNSLLCHSLVELVKCGLMNTLGGYKKTPCWLKSFCISAEEYASALNGAKSMWENVHFAPASFGIANWCHNLYLFQSGQYALALAEADKMRQSLSQNKDELVLNLYYTMLTASCHMKLGGREKALPLVEQAVALVKPDGFYLLLADIVSCLDGMSECGLEKYTKGALNAIASANESFNRGINTLKTEYMEEELPESLTPREREVARLATQSMRNIDIAEALGISTNTVKAHLKAIFEKLDIDKRSRLRETFK